MELKDWKHLEQKSKNQIHEAKVQLEVAKILLEIAEHEIALIGQKVKENASNM